MPNSKVYPLKNPVALAEKIKAEGGPTIDPRITVGTASADGVTLGWSIDYLPAGDTITITVIKKPWVIPMGTIWSHVDALFAA